MGTSSIILGRSQPLHIKRSCNTVRQRTIMLLYPSRSKIQVNQPGRTHSRNSPILQLFRLDNRPSCRSYLRSIHDRYLIHVELTINYYPVASSCHVRIKGSIPGLWLTYCPEVRCFRGQIPYLDHMPWVFSKVISAIGTFPHVDCVDLVHEESGSGSRCTH